jgi:hypothetical protein
MHSSYADHCHERQAMLLQASLIPDAELYRVRAVVDQLNTSIEVGLALRGIDFSDPPIDEVARFRD